MLIIVNNLTGHGGRDDHEVDLIVGDLVDLDVSVEDIKMFYKLIIRGCTANTLLNCT